MPHKGLSTADTFSFDEARSFSKGSGLHSVETTTGYQAVDGGSISKKWDLSYFQVKIFVVLSTKIMECYWHNSKIAVGGIKDTHLMPQTFSLDTNKNEDYPLCV